jgi:hypothetical protein
VAAILGGLTIIVKAAATQPAVAGDTTALTNALAVGLTAIMSGVGIAFARDHTTSDEAAGVTPQQLALKQAVHDAAAAAPTPTPFPAPKA